MLSVIFFKTQLMLTFVLFLYKDILTSNICTSSQGIRIYYERQIHLVIMASLLFSPLLRVKLLVNI